jgi:prepilin-type N-terminal cleavage/methylation domain-containing protein
MNEKTYYFTPTTSALQRGLTLIELAVVLAILVALSTLMIPYVGNFIGKSEVATSNYNSAAVLNAMHQYYAQYGVYPNNLDLLSDGKKPVAYLDDTVQVGRPGWVKAGASGATSTNFGVMQDNGAMSASMAKVGVTKYFYQKAGTPTQDTVSGEWYIKDDKTGARFDATYGSQDTSNAAGEGGQPKQGYGLNGEVILSTGPYGTQQRVMWVADNCSGYWEFGHPECLANILGYRNCKIERGGVCPELTDSQGNKVRQGEQHMLILLGINANNEMINKTIATAPVHFPENKSTNPSLVYSRFLAVFDVDMRADCWLDSIGCDPAKLVGVVVGPDANRGWQTSTTGMQRALKPATE